MNVLEGGKEPYSRVFGLLTLNAHHILNCVPNVEGSYLLSELSSLDLRVVKEVIHQEAHEFGACLLNLLSLLELIEQRA